MVNDRMSKAKGGRHLQINSVICSLLTHSHHAGLRNEGPHLSRVVQGSARRTKQQLIITVAVENWKGKAQGKLKNGIYIQTWRKTKIEEIKHPGQMKRGDCTRRKTRFNPVF